MKLSRPKSLTALALAACVSVPASADAQTTLTADTWFTFSWVSSGVVAESFMTTTSTLLITDGWIIGDVFDIYAGGALIGSTSTPAAADADVQSGQNSGAGAWADARLSKGIFAVTPGDIITIVRTASAPSYSTGTAFIQSTTRQYSVPEPGTALLFAIGLTGMAVFRRRSVIDEV